MNAGIDVVSLSNNHSMDFGSDALFETMDVLSHHGIAYVGAGMNETAARRSSNFISNAVKVSVLAYSWNFYLTNENKGSPGCYGIHAHPVFAKENQPQIAPQTR